MGQQAGFFAASALLLTMARKGAALIMVAAQQGNSIHVVSPAGPTQCNSERHREPICLAADVEQALDLRRKWMRATGYTEEVIADQCDPFLHPANLAEEIENLKAVEHFREYTFSKSELEQRVKSYPEWISD